MNDQTWVDAINGRRPVSVLRVYADWLAETGDPREAGIRWLADRHMQPMRYADGEYRWFLSGKVNEDCHGCIVRGELSRMLASQSGMPSRPATTVPYATRHEAYAALLVAWQRREDARRDAAALRDLATEIGAEWAERSDRAWTDGALDVSDADMDALRVRAESAIGRSVTDDELGRLVSTATAELIDIRYSAE